MEGRIPIWYWWLQKNILEACHSRKIEAPLATLASTQDHSATLFEDWYNGQGEAYLKNNTCIKEGRDSIVKFNKFETEWETVSANDMEPREQYHCLIKLLSQKEMKDDTYGGPIEVMHRWLATAQLLTMSATDQFTAEMKQGNLKIQQFIDLGIGGTK